MRTAYEKDRVGTKELENKCYIKKPRRKRGEVYVKY